jgi:hypothetical protein
MWNRPFLLLSGGGVALSLIGLVLPSLVKLMRVLEIFDGPWGGFGLFVISMYLRPVLVGSGVLLIVLGIVLAYAVRPRADKTVG